MYIAQGWQSSEGNELSSGQEQVRKLCRSLEENGVIIQKGCVEILRNNLTDRQK